MLFLKIPIFVCSWISIRYWVLLLNVNVINCIFNPFLILWYIYATAFHFSINLKKNTHNLLLYWQNTFQCRLINTYSPHNHIKASHIRRNAHSFLAKISHVALIAKNPLENMLNYKSPVVVNDVTLCLKIFQCW